MSTTFIKKTVILSLLTLAAVFGNFEMLTAMDQSDAEVKAPQKMTAKTRIRLLLEGELSKEVVEKKCQEDSSYNPSLILEELSQAINQGLSQSKVFPHYQSEYDTKRYESAIWGFKNLSIIRIGQFDTVRHFLTHSILEKTFTEDEDEHIIGLLRVLAGITTAQNATINRILTHQKEVADKLERGFFNGPRSLSSKR